MLRLHRGGLPVPAPIAARYRLSGFTYTGDLITERIESSRSLAQRLVDSGLPLEDWIAVGRCIRRFHDFGLCHADLNAHNVMFDGAGAVWLIDFDRGRLRRAGLWRDANLVRLRRSLLKVTDPLPPGHFTETDWRSLLAGYASAPAPAPAPAPRSSGAGPTQPRTRRRRAPDLRPDRLPAGADRLWRHAVAQPPRPHHWQNFGERFGFGPGAPVAGSIWVHAVSVGEVRAAASLVRELRRRYPVGAAGAEHRDTDRCAAHASCSATACWCATCTDLPGRRGASCFDRCGRGWRSSRDRALPTLYRCGRRRVPCWCWRARVSRRARWALSPPRRPVPRNAVARHRDRRAERRRDADVRSIGANPQRTHVTGNIIRLQPAGSRHRRMGHRLRSTRTAPPSGSPARTRASEEAALDAQAAVRAAGRRAAGAGAAPSQSLRGGAELLQQRGLRSSGLQRRRQPRAAVAQNGAARTTSGPPGTPDGEVLLVDTLGELLAFYAAADVAFVAGSLVPVGGHNLLEPLSVGVPALTGPHVFNAEDIARLLVERRRSLAPRCARHDGGRVAGRRRRRQRLAETGLALLAIIAALRTAVLLAPRDRGAPAVMTAPVRRRDQVPTAAPCVVQRVAAVALPTGAVLTSQLLTSPASRGRGVPAPRVQRQRSACSRSGCA